MNREYGKHTAETFQRLKDYFLSNEVSVEKLSQISRQVCGEEVSLDTLLRVSGREAWEIERSTRQFANFEEVRDEVELIRRIIVQQIVSSNDGGLLITGEFDEAEVQAALKSIPGLKIVRVRPGAVGADLINAYMNLLSKTNANLNMPNSSARTSREQVLDQIKQTAKEMGVNGY